MCDAKTTEKTRSLKRLSGHQKHHRTFLIPLFAGNKMDTITCLIITVHYPDDAVFEAALYA